MYKKPTKKELYHDERHNVLDRLNAILDISDSNNIIYLYDIDNSPDRQKQINDLADDVKKLKMEAGKDLVVYGGNSFVSSLVAEQLVDEFILYVNPVVLGKGEPIFNKISAFQQLKLLRSKTFPSGIVLLHYSL